MVENGADLQKAKRNDGLLPIHFAASNNDVHLLEYILEQAENAKTAANMTNEEGWTPGHFAGFLNNFDSLNLLIENGADLRLKNRNGLSCFDEVVRSDNADLFECVWPYAKNLKRDLNEVSQQTNSQITLSTCFLESFVRLYSLGSRTGWQQNATSSPLKVQRVSQSDLQ